MKVGLARCGGGQAAEVEVGQLGLVFLGILGFDTTLGLTITRCASTASSPNAEPDATSTSAARRRPRTESRGAYGDTHIPAPGAERHHMRCTNTSAARASTTTY